MAINKKGNDISSLSPASAVSTDRITVFHSGTSFVISYENNILSIKGKLTLENGLLLKNVKILNFGTTWT
ncbi:MAG: hypothetical protein WBB27_11695 [Maribacter sp.]